jgi:hypothetical protein
MAKYGTWANFETSFREMFVPVDASIVALNKINRLKQQRSLTSYVAEFCALVAVANVKESHVLIHMFNLGLNNNLLCTIHMMGDIPNDFDKYLTAVMKIDSNINQGNTTISLTNANQYQNHCPQSKPQKRDDDAMDVDCLDEEARTDHMAKGLCFNCHKNGHQANRCT